MEGKQTVSPGYREQAGTDDSGAASSVPRGLGTHEMHTTLRTPTRPGHGRDLRPGLRGEPHGTKGAAATRSPKPT